MARRFDAALAPDLGEAADPRWNVPPTQPVLALVHPDPERAARADPPIQLSDSGRLLTVFRWGLVPWWAKDPSIGNKLFNARAETLETKAAFRSALERKRCLVLADGFYEWKREELAGRRHRTPFFFTRSDEEPMAFAGLWESWRDPKLPREKATRLLTCTIITTDSGPDVESVHNRMPVVVERDDIDEWLDPAPLDEPELHRIVLPSPAGTLTEREVSPMVNSVQHEGPELVEAVG